MIRLFTGLALPPDVAAAVSVLRGGLAGARWIDESDYHVTLQFAGNIEEHIADELNDVLSRIRREPLEIILDGVQIFGGGKPRSIIVGVRATPSLVDLQAIHERIFRQLQIPVETRKFVPHVTIARLKGVTPAAVAEFVSALGYFRPMPFMADAFNLFSSVKSSGGGPYSIEASYELRA